MKITIPIKGKTINPIVFSDFKFTTPPINKLIEYVCVKK